MAKKYWLLKSEPDCYSIEDLEKDGTTFWDGVRNYQARNFMRDDMEVGDEVLFYHSNATPPGVAGVAKIAARAYADHTQFDKKSDHYDPKSDPADPRWLMVDVQFVKKFPEVLPLPALKEESALDGMELLRKGSRLSVQPVSKAHFQHVLKMAKKRK